MLLTDCEYIVRRVQGKPVRVHKQLSAEKTAKVVQAAKEAGFSLTVLFEAAQILATFARNDITPEIEESAHVTLDCTL